MRRRLVVAVAFALVAAGCGGSSDERGSSDESPTTVVEVETLEVPAEDASAASRLAEALRSDDLDDRLAAAIEALARAGVGTHYDQSQNLVQDVTEPVSALAFLRYQVRNIATDEPGQGYVGSGIDDTLPAPPEHIPTSYLMAGYVADVDTFGAELSRELMQGQDLTDPPGLVFPRLVVTLFAADVFASAAGASGQSFGAFHGRSFVPASAGEESAAQSFCAKVQTFFSNVWKKLGEIANSVAANLPIIGPLVGFGTVILGYAADVVANLVKNTPFLSHLRMAVGVLSVIVMAGAAMQPWVVSLAAKPGFLHHQVGSGSEVKGSFTATVNTGVDPLDAVRPCAELADISIPPMETAVGSKVTWDTVEGFPEHAVETKRDSTVGAGSKAALAFDAATETQEQHDGGAEQDAPVVVGATVQRGSVQLFDKLLNDLFAKVPLVGLLRDLIGTLLPDAQAAITKILGLKDAYNVTAALVSFHAQSALSFSLIWEPPYRRWVWEGVSCGGLEGPWNMKLTVVGYDVLAGVAGEGTTSFTLTDGAGTFDATVTAVLPGGVTGYYRYVIAVTAIGDTSLAFDGTESVSTIGVTAETHFGTAPIVALGACPG